MDAAAIESFQPLFQFVHLAGVAHGCGLLDLPRQLVFIGRDDLVGLPVLLAVTMDLARLEFAGHGQRGVGAMQAHVPAGELGLGLIPVLGLQKLRFGQLNDFAVLDGINVILLALGKGPNLLLADGEEHVLLGGVVARLVISQQLVACGLDHGHCLPPVKVGLLFHSAPALLIVRKIQTEQLIQRDGLLVSDGGGQQWIADGGIKGGLPHFHRVVNHQFGHELQEKAGQLAHLRHPARGNRNLPLVIEVELRVEVLERDDFALARRGGELAFQVFMQIGLLEIDVNLVDDIVAAQDVVRAGVMIRFVLQLAPPARVEKIGVIAVFVTQGEAAQVPGHRPGRDNQGPVTLIEKVERLLGLVGDDEHVPRQAHGDHAVVEQLAISFVAVAHRLDIGDPMPADGIGDDRLLSG